MKYRTQLKIWEANYGRETGWVIEQNGRPIAILSDVKYHDMFWESYVVTPISSDACLNERMKHNEFWAIVDIKSLVYRNREFDAVVDNAFPATGLLAESGRILMRGLYIASRKPLPIELLLMKLLRHFKR